MPLRKRIAFRPETFTVEEILAEPNAEVRRVMRERVGFAWFFQNTRAELLDRDCDSGGECRLPRVPPVMTTCRQAAARLAGFDDPANYRPLVES